MLEDIAAKLQAKILAMEYPMFYKVLNDNNNRLMGAVASLITLNMMDGVFTIAWIESGKATEINPLMDLLISIHPFFFMTIKILLVSLGALLLWRFRYMAIAVNSLYLCLTVYSILILYHGTGLMS